MQNITMSNLFNKISITKFLVIIDFFILIILASKKTGEYEHLRSSVWDHFLWSWIDPVQRLKNLVGSPVFEQIKLFHPQYGSFSVSRVAGCVTDHNLFVTNPRLKIWITLFFPKLDRWPLTILGDIFALNFSLTNKWFLISHSVACHKFENYALNTEIVAAVGMLKKQNHHSKDFNPKSLSTIFQNYFFRSKIKILTW